MKDYMFTIITVCYNAEKCIEGTIVSLLEQTCENYEYVVKDGMSTDSTMETVRSMLKGKENVQIISKPDSGIYDAMNQAVEMAHGKYIYFLNAGDSFADEFVLDNVNKFIYLNDFADVVYGDIILVNNGLEKVRKYPLLCSSKVYFLTGDCICHQAMFAKRMLFLERKFNLAYKVCADKEWQLNWICRNKKFSSMGLVISKVLADGFSARHVKELETETEKCLNQYLKKGIWAYKGVYYMKHNIWGIKILRRVGEVIFFKGNT